MNVPRISGSFLVLLLLGVGILAGLPLVATAHAESVGSWTTTTPFPTGASYESCVTYGDYVYCAGGYYATISSSGIGTWMKTTSYPDNLTGESCVTYDGYIYCFGGWTGCPCTVTSGTFYAPLSSSGIGTWVASTNDSSNREYGAGCSVSSAGYMYCVGGQSGVDSPQDNTVAFAPLSSSGIGTWMSGTSYPEDIYEPNCLTSSSYLYCVGGTGYEGGSTPVFNDSYYASISSTGVGAWTKTTTYPSASGRAEAPDSCVTSGAYVYCLGSGSGSGPNSVYYGAVSPSGGIGPWTSTSQYPGGEPFTCVTSAGFIYCFNWGSATHTAYYTAIASTSQVNVDSVNTSGATITGYRTVLYSASGSIVAEGFTPSTFTVNAGQTYGVRAESYGSCTFSKWSDGVTSDPRTFTATSSPITFTVVYNCGSPTTSSVTINSVDQNGQTITGYRTVLYNSSGSIIDEGFTPSTFTVTAGAAYQARAESYGSCTFSKWSDGVTSDPRAFTASSSPVTFTAVYDCTSPTSTITVTTVNGSGSTITGYYITLWQGGNQVNSCFSTCSFTVNNGQTYQVEAASYGSEHFSHWQNDGATGRETVNVPSASTTISLTAVYSP